MTNDAWYFTVLQRRTGCLMYARTLAQIAPALYWRARKDNRTLVVEPLGNTDVYTVRLDDATSAPFSPDDHAGVRITAAESKRISCDGP